MVAKDPNSEETSNLVISNNNKAGNGDSESQNSVVFKGEEQEIDVKVSEILKGNFASIEIPLLDIPGSRPLIYEEPEDLLAQINEKDEFFIEDDEEEFLMFTAEIIGQFNDPKDLGFDNI